MLEVLLAIILILGAISLWRFRQGADENTTLINKIPGPATLPIIGNLHSFIGKDAEGYLKEISRLAVQFPRICRTWWLNVPIIHTSHPSYIEILLTSTQNIRKSQDYQFISEWLGTGLLTSSGFKWHSRRKLLTPAFHFKILEQFVSVFNAKSQILVSKLREQCCTHEQGFDVVPFITLTALDIICETAMGTTINAQEDASSTYVTTIHETNALLLHRMLSPWLYPDFMFKLSTTGRKFKKCVTTLHNFTYKVIRERRSELNILNNKVNVYSNDKTELELEGSNKKRPAFLDLLLGMDLSDEDIREEVDTFMFEGHDTTAMGMSWVLLFIASNPEVQEKCWQEQVELLQSPDAVASMSDLNNMKYLERVIKESLRLRPSVFVVARNLDQSLQLLDDYEIPAGTDVNIDILNLHNNPETFPEPEKFDPDRFLPENCQGRHPFAYIPFSAGQRNCIGQKFAMLEEKCVLSNILRNFEISAVHPDRDRAMVPDLMLRPKYGINIKLKSRN